MARIEVKQVYTKLKTQSPWGATALCKGVSKHVGDERQGVWLADPKKGIKEVTDFESAKTAKRRPGPLKNGGWTCLTVIEDDSYAAVSRTHRVEQVVAGDRLGSKDAYIIDSPSDRPLIHINRDLHDNVIVFDSEGTLFHWNPVKEWMTVQRDFVVSSKSTIVSKFVGKRIVVLILTSLSKICNATVVKLSFDNERASVERIKLDCYTFPLLDSSADFEVGMTATISQSADYLAFTMSYRYPKLNEIIFMNPNNNGSILRINLEGCGINANHIHNPTAYEATHYKVASIHFSICDYMVFGLTNIGTMFVVSTLGSLHELISSSNTVTTKPTKFLPVALFEPLLNRQPQIYSLSASLKDPFLLASDGYGLNIIKYPNLHVKNMNVFLNQLLTSSYLLLNRKEMEPESASDSRALTIKPSVIKKKNIPNFFKNVFDTVLGKPKEGALQISTSMTNLNLPKAEVETDSEHSDDEASHYKTQTSNKLRERFNLALLPAFEKASTSKLSVFEIICATEESIRGSFGAILVNGTLNDDEHNCLVDIVTLFGRFSAAAVSETPRLGETIFNRFRKISIDISQLGWWDQRKGILLGLLDRVTDLLLCAQGSLVARTLVTQPWPAEWKHTLLTTEAELSKTYKCKVQFELARSDVYKLCCSAAESPDLFHLKEWLHRELCDIGVVPLSLPADETHRNEELTDKELQMSQYLSQYDLLAATTFFCQLLVEDIKSFENTEETYERIYAMSTFVLLISAYYGRVPVMIPSPSINRNMVLEPSLIKKSIEMSKISTHFNPSMALSLILLTADFSSASKYCAQLNSIQNAIVLQAVGPIFSLQYNHSNRLDVNAVEMDKLITLLESLVEFRLAKFLKDDQCSNNQLPFSIISPFIIANCAKIDLLSTVIHAQIQDVLGLMNQAGAGSAEPGPFAPLVLAQPGILNDGTSEEKIRAEIAKKIQLCLSLLNCAGLDRFFSKFFGSKIRASIAKAGGDTDMADLFLNELRDIRNDSISWDDQTKPLFACIRVIFSFLWMFFCRDQYRRAAFLFRRAVEGDEAISQGTSSELVQTSSHLINKIARLYQFSDVLHCRADLQSAMITAAMESKPNEQISNQLARIFYNEEMICRQNDRERLKFLVDHKLDLYLPDGTRQDDTLDLVPGGSCRDVFIRQCTNLEQQEHNFHISGENFDEYIAHFGRTKFKKYERSSDFLAFMAAQIHLFQANMEEKPISLIQNRHEIICRLAKDYNCNDQFNPLSTPPKYDLPMVSAGSGVSRQLEYDIEKSKIKDKLTNALNLSATTSSSKSPHKRSSSTSNIARQRSDSILFSLKTKSSSTEHLNRTGVLNPTPSKTLRNIKSVSLGEKESGSLRTFISRRMSDITGFRSKAESDPVEKVEYEPEIIDYLDELSGSELYKISRSAGGRQVLDTNVAALLNWVFMDQRTASNPEQPLESLSINRFHLTLAVLIHDKRTTKKLLGMIDRINNTTNESLDTSKMEMVTRMATPAPEQRQEPVFPDSPCPPKPEEAVPEALVNIEETELAQTPFVQERKPARITSPEIAPEKVEKIMREESVKYSEPDKKVNSEQLMIQQMSLMTQMMGIMAENMQQKAEVKQKSDEPEVTRIPVRDSMYRRSQSATLRQISPRSESVKYNDNLKRCNGLPLLELPGSRESASFTPRSNGKENTNPRFTRSQSEPVKVPSLRQKTVVQEPKPRKEFAFIHLPGVGEDKTTKEKTKSRGLIEYSSVARYVAQKSDQTRTRRCVLLEGQNMGHVNVPKTLPEKKAPMPSVLVQSEPKPPHHRVPPATQKLVNHQDERPLTREDLKADFERIGTEIRQQFEQAQMEVQQMHIEQIKKQARESVPVPTLTEKNSPERVSSLRSASKSSLKSSDSEKETLKKSISFHESIKMDSKTYSKSSDQSIEGLAEQVTAELEALRQTPDLGIDLSELNSLQKDIEPMSPSRPKFDGEMDSKSVHSGRLSQRSRGVTASSERRKDQILTENNHQRKNDALHMAKEVLNSPPKTNATVKTPKKKTPKKSPSKTPSRSSSADRVYRKSVRGPPSSRSPSKTKITIDPFRRTENSVNPANEPKWRERTRMEVARGTGLYSSTMKKTPSKPNMAAPPAPEAKTSEELIEMTAPPKVRSVAQILEMTKVSISEFLNTDEAPAPYHDEDELELSRHEYREDEQFSTIPPEEGVGGYRSPSVESGLSSIYSLLNEVDNDYHRYLNDS